MVWHKEIMGELWMRLNETVVVIVVVVVVSGAWKCENKPTVKVHTYFTRFSSSESIEYY